MDGVDGFPIALTLRVAGLAMLFVVPAGLALARLQARYRYPGRRLVDALVLLPLVLPPSVIGFFLVVLLGRRGPIGRWLDASFDLQLVFTPAAAVLEVACRPDRQAGSPPASQPDERESRPARPSPTARPKPPA